MKKLVCLGLAALLAVQTTACGVNAQGADTENIVAEDIGEAEDNYNDVAYQFAQLNVGQINDAQQQIIQLYQDMEEALKGIDESDAERRQAVMDDYMAQIAFWEDQMQIAFD